MDSWKRARRLLPALVLVAGGIACAGSGSSPPAAVEPSLYERLGGQPAISAVVDRFVDNIVADDRLRERFGGGTVRRRRLLVEQICEATGGPCTYTGADMVSAHAGLDVSDEEFDWTAAHLVSALDAFDVPAREKNELLGLIGSMRPQVVGQ